MNVCSDPLYLIETRSSVHVSAPSPTHRSQQGAASTVDPGGAGGAPAAEKPWKRRRVETLNVFQRFFNVFVEDFVIFFEFFEAFDVFSQGVSKAFRPLGELTGEAA